MLLGTLATAVGAEPGTKPESAPDQTSITISAPAQVPQATRFSVTWTGPGKRYDSIMLVDPAAHGGAGKRLRRRLLSHDDYPARRVELPAPIHPGHYELRFWDADAKTVLTTAPIEVIAQTVSLRAPASAPAGSEVTVTWTGPGARYDTVQLYDPSARQGRGKILHSRRVSSDDFANRRVTLPAPADPGSYRLRYWNSDNKAILTTRDLSVTAR